VKESRGGPGAAHIVAVEGEGWSGQLRGGDKFSTGDDVIVLIRPEDISLGDLPVSDTGLAWQGRVAQSIFRGSHCSMVIETPVHRFHVEGPAVGAANIGETVRLSVPATSAWVIHA
jgi:iron(III) transport system ATP-binding protein